MNFRFLLLAPFALLSACDPISEDQCKSGDWSGIGLSDGKRGKPASLIDEYAEICGEFGISPARTTYLAARTQGLKTYCTPQSAYQVGRRGSDLSPVCSPEQVANMQAAFNHGKTYHEIASIIEALGDEIDELQSVLKAFPNTPSEEEAERIARINRRIERLEDRVFDLERDRRAYARWP